MKRRHRVITLPALAAIGLMAPVMLGSGAVSAQTTERVAAQDPRFSKIVVVARPVPPRPKPAPVPLLGVGLPAFAAAGMAVAGYKFWRRRRARA